MKMPSFCLALLIAGSLLPSETRAFDLFHRHPAAHHYPAMGRVERLDPALDRILSPSATIEKLAGGFAWAGGALWRRSTRSLLLSDVANNVIFRWKQAARTAVFLNRCGYTGSAPRAGLLGPDGLAFDREGRLVFCAQGDHAVVRLEPDGGRTLLARYYKWQRLNSPCQLVYKSNGDLYFTDPPFGLPKGNQDPAKELAFNGVYRLSKTGELSLLVSDLSYPDGIAFSPDERTLYISVCDPAHPRWMAYPVDERGAIGPGRIFAEAPRPTAAQSGLPRGLTVDQRGNLFASGPGGIWILSPAGRQLGAIMPGEVAANCAFGDNGSTLYISAHNYLCRIKTLTRGKLSP